MTWRKYSSTDVGAPVWNGQPGSAINVLSGCLVTGFGGNTPAGWSMPFSGADKAVFKPAIGGGYHRWDDGTARGGSSPRVASVSVYETMTSVDSGVGLVFSGYQMKSNSVDTSAHGWVVLADEGSFYLLIRMDAAAIDSANSKYHQVLSHYGLYDAFISGDPWVFGGSYSDVDQPGLNYGGLDPFTTSSSAPASSGHNKLARPYSAAATPVSAIGIPISNTGNFGYGNIIMRNADDWTLTRGYGLHDSVDVMKVRCHFPAMYAVCNRQSDIASYGSTGLLLDGPGGHGTLFGIRFAPTYSTDGMVFIDMSDNRAP